MKLISALNNIHIKGEYGDFEGKEQSNIIKIKEIENIKIFQIVRFKNSTKKNEDLKINNLELPNTLKVSADQDTRILWIGPSNWLVFSKNKNIKNDINNIFTGHDFAVTDLSHSRAIIELEGNNVKDVIKKCCPYNIDLLQKNDTANSVYNGITITLDCLNQSPDVFRVVVLRSFGESLYNSVTDSCLEFGYKSL